MLCLTLDKVNKGIKHSMSPYYNFYSSGARKIKDLHKRRSMYAVNEQNGVSNVQVQAILAAHFQHRLVVVCNTRAIKKGKA